MADSNNLPSNNPTPITISDSASDTKNKTGMNRSLQQHQDVKPVNDPVTQPGQSAQPAQMTVTAKGSPLRFPQETVKVTVEGKLYLVHKFLLDSEYWKVMFDGRFIERNGEVDLGDETKAEVFGLYVDVLYHMIGRGVDFKFSDAFGLTGLTTLLELWQLSCYLRDEKVRALADKAIDDRLEIFSRESWMESEAKFDQPGGSDKLMRIGNMFKLAYTYCFEHNIWHVDKILVAAADCAPRTFRLWTEHFNTKSDDIRFMFQVACKVSERAHNADKLRKKSEPEPGRSNKRARN